LARQLARDAHALSSQSITETPKDLVLGCAAKPLPFARGPKVLRVGLVGPGVVLQGMWCFQHIGIFLGCSGHLWRALLDFYASLVVRMWVGIKKKQKFEYGILWVLLVALHCAACLLVDGTVGSLVRDPRQHLDMSC
jgi:hypothetical protein